MTRSPLKPLRNRLPRPVELELKTKNIVSRIELGKGENKPELVVFEDGSKAVWKPHREWFASNYRAEVLAYELDQTLGFNLVPATIEKTIDGKIGSLQAFVPDAVEAFRAPRIKPSQLDKQTIFDYIISNGDRHQGNFLVNKEGNIYSIDNGISFGNRVVPRPDQLDVDRFIKSKEGTRIYERIKSLDLNQLKKDIAIYIEPEAAEKVILRIRVVMSWYSSP